MKSLQERLYNWEEQPPGKAWEAIGHELDQSEIGSRFIGKLAGTTVQPPIESWDKIEAALDEENPTDTAPVKPLRRIRIYRFAAAIAALLIVALAIWQWIPTRETGRQESASATARPDTSGLNESTGHLPEEPEAELTSTSPDGVNEEPAGRDQSRSVAYRNSGSRISLALQDLPASPVFAFNEESGEMADRYIVLMSPNGPIRISKKWGSLVCCVSGEDDAVDCKDQLRKWQEKLACSAASSGANVMDVLSLAQSLESDL